MQHVCATQTAWRSASVHAFRAIREHKRNGQDVHRTTEQLLQVRIDSALLHVRLNKMLSWSLRSKRLYLKKRHQTQRFQTQCTRHRRETRANHEPKSSTQQRALSNRHQEENTEKGQQVTITWLLRQLTYPFERSH